MIIKKATKALKKLLIKNAAFSNPLPTYKSSLNCTNVHTLMTFISHLQIAISNALTYT